MANTSKSKKLAVLTSGGDASGMNACIRTVVRYGLNQGYEMFGVRHGYKGLLNDEIVPMPYSSVSNCVHAGGTILRTSRCPEFKDIEVMKKGVDNLLKKGIDNLIVIGGDGSFRGARDLSDEYPDITVMGIPGTIDNDLNYTDYTLGFDSAVNTTLWAINNLRDTMGSHDRVSLLEVMGRGCGDIALYAGIAGGAEYVIIPEVPYDIDAICRDIRSSQKRGKTSNMIILAEGAGDKDAIVAAIKEKTGISVKITTLGHIQRGGTPTMFDRVLAARMAVKAVDLIAEGAKSSLIGIRDNKITADPIQEALDMPRRFDEELYSIAHILSL